MGKPAVAIMAAAVVMTVQPAMAQSVPGQAAPDTILHLSASGSVQVAPDLLVADLMIQSVQPSAAAA